MSLRLLLILAAAAFLAACEAENDGPFEEMGEDADEAAEEAEDAAEDARDELNDPS